MISIVDYGVGNLKSLQNAFEFIGTKSELVDSQEGIGRAEKLILPGVGAFAYAMDNIQKRNLDRALIEKAKSGSFILGICLGMQLLFSKSSEGGSHRGLDLIAGEVTKISGVIKVPHIGWNEIQLQGRSALLRNLPDSRYGYFVHSYICVPNMDGCILATTEYGITFASVVQSENIFGVQFHPEKSQELGLRILKNFVEL